MREIKFRVFIEKMEEVQKPFSIIFHNEETCSATISVFRDKFETVAVPVKHVMQYVGLKDKNDKEIYEGDIIHFKRNGDFLGADMMLVAEYYNGCFCAGTLQWDYVLKHGVVVGNIYENQDLLEKE